MENFQFFFFFLVAVKYHKGGKGGSTRKFPRRRWETKAISWKSSPSPPSLVRNHRTMTELLDRTSIFHRFERSGATLLADRTRIFVRPRGGGGWRWEGGRTFPIRCGVFTSVLEIRLTRRRWCFNSRESSSLLSSPAVVIIPFRCEFRSTFFCFFFFLRVFLSIKSLSRQSWDAGWTDVEGGIRVYRGNYNRKAVYSRFVKFDS